MKLRIRHAADTDIPRMLAMGRRFHLETRYSDLTKIDWHAVEATAHALIAAESGAIFVAVLDATIIGMLGLSTYTHPLSGELLATELFWWVEPEYRGSAGIKLLRAGERWARLMGAIRLQMIAPTPEIETLYDRLRYTRVEVNYQKELR